MTESPVTEPLVTEPPAPERDRRALLRLGGIGCVVAGAVVLLAVFVGSLGSDGSGTGASSATTTTISPVAASGIADGTTAPLGDGALGEGTAPERDGRSPLAGFGEVAVTITSGDGEVCEVCLLSAVTDAQRKRGLMEVTDTDLGGYDGMLFEFPAPVPGAFWMRNTPMPLSIAYFDAQGKLVSTADMAPCEDSPNCPSYPADRPFQYALEVPKGLLDEVGVDGAATLQIDARDCPLADTGS